jgi:hypothetical protein
MIDFSKANFSRLQTNVAGLGKISRRNELRDNVGGK